MKFQWYLNQFSTSTSIMIAINFMFNLCLFSSYVMPGEQRTRSWLTSLYNKDTVIDSFVETNDKIPGEAQTLISENIQSLFYCLMKLTYWKFRMGRVLYLLYNVHLYKWSRHQNMDGFLWNPIILYMYLQEKTNSLLCEIVDLEFES